MTEAESAILATLWRRGPLPFVSLIEDVKADHAWADATIKTLLHRLIQKRAVASVKDEGRTRYHPTLDRDAYVEGELAAVAQRLFGGDVDALKAFLERRMPSA